ncbi:MAG: lysoplasmalogenase [Saprospiraceae bacterium]|nr:lysoplasmalogenase [Saprospiraceae bacterium]
MQERANLWLYAFWAFAGVEILGEIMHFHQIIYATKPFMMPLLAIWFAKETADENFHKRARTFIIIGLILSALGDTLLMLDREFQGAGFFLFGLGAFLCTHICYTIALFSMAGARVGYMRRNIWLLLPFLLYLAFFLKLLWPGIPEGMQVPVAVYGTAITIMALAAVNLRDHVPLRGYRMVVFGALFFLLSDSLIGIARFVTPFRGAGIAIMVTYIVGQYGIARGVKEIFWE